MTRQRFGQRDLNTVFLSLFLILSGLIFMGLKVRCDQVNRGRVPGSAIIYIPSGKYLKYATFGYSSVLADLIYLWAIQYYSDYSIADRFNYLEHIFSIIAELDPRYIDPYELGALVAVYEAGNLELGLKILDMGLEKNPDQWIFPFEAAHFAQMRKNYEIARLYYKKAMEIPGAPDIVKRLYAFTAFKTMDLETSWKMWLEIYQTTSEERVKKIANNHLYQVKAAIDKQLIERAVAQFKEKFGRNPYDLSQLVRTGLLREIPRDLDGLEYIYDPRTGEVKAAQVWWKR
ncbi:MAG: tetratricopeptide repeat protein [Candidatus Aminicenantales bacterium]